MSFKNQKRKVKAAAEQRIAAYHESAHAVAALALGVELESVRLLPKPRMGFVPSTADDYQTAVVAFAGPISDSFCAPQVFTDSKHRALLEAWFCSSKDVGIVMGCAARASDVEMGHPTDELDGWSVYSPVISQTDRAAMLAWALAVDVLTNRLVSENWDAVKAVSRALCSSPHGLTLAQARLAAGALRTLSVDQLHSAIDTIARSALSEEATLIAKLAARKVA